MSFESSKGWRWFVEKINDEVENLIIYCILINPSNDTECNGDSGECLDSVEIENKTHQLHIGTEDSEALSARAFHNNFMPPRFRNQLGFESYQSFTEQIDFGFKTTIPQLKKTEKIYFHYLVATNKIKPSIEYPRERDISTWYAVDHSKTLLDRYLEQDNK